MIRPTCYRAGPIESIPNSLYPIENGTETLLPSRLQSSYYIDPGTIDKKAG